jgi:hypothetical protein
MSFNVETIPAARNLVHNPRPVSTANFSTSGTTTFVTDRSYSGTGSILVQLTAAADQFVQWHAAGMSDSDLSSIPSGATIRAMFHISGPIPAGFQCFLSVQYTDDTFTVVTVNPLVVASTAFHRIILPDLTLTPGKTVKYLYVTVNRPGGGAGTAATFYLGGFDVRVNQPLDSFVHGAGGVGYAWEGSANNSPSTRDQIAVSPSIGSGGQIYPTVTVQVVNRRNQVIRDITGHFRDGDINYDLDAEQWKGTLNITLDEPGLVEVLGDEFIRISMRIERADGTVEEGSLGMFSVDAPTERWSAGGYDTWNYEGRDLLALLATWVPRNLTTPISTITGQILPVFGIKVGETYIGAITDLLVKYVGLSADQFSFPGLNAIVKAGSAIVWEVGTDALAILSELLTGAGWQKPWLTPGGVITSAPGGLQPSQVTPSLVMATGENSRIRWPFEVDPETSAVGNRVRVISIRDIVTQIGGEYIQGAWIPDEEDDDKGGGKGKKKKKKNKGDDPGGSFGPGSYTEVSYVTTYAAVVTVRANLDPGHPLSVPRLGRFIDLPDVKAPAASSQAAVDALADQALANASMIPMRVRLTTEVMIRGLNEVYELDMKDAYGDPIESGQGRYWCRGWSFQLGPPWEMVHNLTRVVSFATVPWDQT